MSYITCNELITFLGDYIAGELPPPRRTEFERHLSVCPSCVHYLDSYRETIRLAHGTAIAPSVEDVPPELLAVLLSTVARNTSH